MRNKIIVLFLLSFFVNFAQNETKYAVIPNKFSFLKKENPYNLSTNLKLYFEKIGYKAVVMGEELPVGINTTSCNTIYPDLLEDNGLMTTKVTIIVKNCKGEVIAKSKEGLSVEKDRRTAYLEALRAATEFFIIPSVIESTQSAGATALTDEMVVSFASDATTIYAQPIENGFQLVDATPKLVMKIYKTSQPDYFTAVSDIKNGVVFKKEGVWYFEYYQDNVLKSEKLNIKF